MLYNHTIQRATAIMAIIAAICLNLIGCKAPEDIAYLRTIQDNQEQYITQAPVCTIQPDDLLSITVSSETPESAIPFNQETSRAINNGNSYTMVGSALPSNGYLVDGDGRITYPVFGRINVAGLTTADLADTLEQRLISSHYISDPEVTVRLLNNKVTVLGEVNLPGEVKVAGERITIFEAIAKCGDLTINGQRQNVLIVREENGKRLINRVDLTNESIFDSPYYYLRQNDVVYIEPNNMKKKMAQMNETKVLSLVSTGASIITSIFNVYYYYKIASTRR